MRILLIEDDASLGGAVQEHLRLAGHAVDWLTRLGDAARSLASMHYDMTLLDLALPDGNGLALLKQLRRQGDWGPVIVLTARDQLSDRIAGLDAGADDYLVKPFDLAELCARVNAVARRSAAHPDPEIRLGTTEIHLADRRALRDGHSVSLTAREWTIVALLVHRPGAAVPQSRIEDALYAFGAEVESNAVEVHISRMRKKLGHGFIETLRGVGYRVPVGT